MSTTNILCPECGKPIAIEEVLKHQVEEQLLSGERKKHQEELVHLREQTLKDAKSQAQKEFELTLRTNEEEKREIKERNTKLQDQILELTKQIRLLLSQQEDLKIEHERKLTQQLTEERSKIREEAKKQAEETNSLKVLELEKKLADFAKANEDMKRKIEQGSQQLQGEVLELELENQLRTEFPMDEILPVAKGIRGADVRQVVKDRNGNECGAILWELKNAQWTDKWIDKLREDQRVTKSDIAVLVSVNLPSTITQFALQKGIWVASRSICMALAQALRLQLYHVYTSKQSQVGKNEKKEILYAYMSSNEFKQRVEAIAESFISMQEDVEVEKRWYAKKWAKQEKNIRRALDNTLGMHGDLHSIMGTTLPEISRLQLDESLAQ